ncbi:undecaprenyl-phosphate glucose phosphotransferase [Pectobacterium aquaticum]|uniref:undecaprenyl-phosphate glucose phosphotransferase n=1 Tax=Pectobacterium aquaticum TaxID=2204145 RepID=UPI000E2220A0|nr:undecaprenyl-phosphate glucose phosphotransferase [Pectobacterium aquaticum]RRO02004.1 undecaprenyl-phosphate glucose phosphotransferase [Pectobacterium aquaticum]
MSRKQKDIIHFNASLISILQRMSDVFVVFFSIPLVIFIKNENVLLQHWLISLVSFSIFQTIGGITDFYRSWRGVSLRKECSFLVRNWFLANVFCSGILSLLPSLFVGLEFYCIWFFVTSLGFILARSSIRLIISYARKLGFNNKNIAIIGSSKAGVALIENILSAHWLGFKVLGYYMPDGGGGCYNKMGLAYLGDVDDLILSAKKGSVDRIYIALHMEDAKIINYILSELSDTTCTVMLVPDVFTFNILQSRSETINGISVFSLYDTPMNGFNSLVKRFEDIIISIIIIILITPLLLIIALLIKKSSPGPIIFKQKRYGIDGKPIDVWKFRSMNVMENGDKITQAKKIDSRVTPLGAFLRRTSLDELPQFFNVIKGDMSIVGPRPHAIAHNEQYRRIIKGYMLRHKVKPGVTGWAQVNGWRGETDTLEKMEKRIEFDLYYIQNWSLLMDLKIIISTIFKGFVNKSAY